MRKTSKPKGLAKIWREIKKPFQRIATWINPEKAKKTRSVHQNYQRKIKQLSQSNEKIKVVFLVSQCAKWNADSLYRRLEADNRFSPIVLYVPLHERNNIDTNENMEHRFFVERGYNFAAISSGGELRAHKPDIVFYQQPWGALTGEFAPVEVSQYALCLYFPYSIATSIEAHGVWKECSPFFKTLYRHFVFNAAVAEQFNALGVHNTLATGHPKLDAYMEPVKTNPWKNKGLFKIVYAPHHSVGRSKVRWGTFGWNGRELLEWAKIHTDTEWIFKPHPYLRYALGKKAIITESELDEYYDEWNKIGSVYTQGDYFDIFRTADLLVTDCGSFLTEWLPTEKPCIHLLSDKEVPNSRSFVHEKSSRHYYKVKNLEELYAALEMLVVRREDPLAVARIQDAKEIPLDSAKNIHHWLIQTLCKAKEGSGTTGITFGTYDLFHIGHLNLLRNARSQCDRLIVGVSSGERVFKYKNKYPIVPDNERLEIVRSCRFVDDTFLNDGDPGNPDSYTEWGRKFGATKWFVGDDWQGTDKFEKLSALSKEFNCELIYLPHTDGISTTDLVKRILDTGKRMDPAENIPFSSFVETVQFSNSLKKIA